MTQTEALYVRQALAYVSNVPFLLREREHGRLADEATRAEQKAFWSEALDRLKLMLEKAA